MTTAKDLFAEMLVSCKLRRDLPTVDLEDLVVFLSRKATGLGSRKIEPIRKYWLREVKRVIDLRRNP